jgi:hypothetical protein
MLYVMSKAERRPDTTSVRLPRLVAAALFAEPKVHSRVTNLRHEMRVDVAPSTAVDCTGGASPSGRTRRSGPSSRRGYLRPLRQAVREGRVAPGDVEQEAGLIFDRLADLYIEHYVKAQGLSSADTIEYRMAALRKRFGNRPLAEIKTADIEDFVATLKQPALPTKYYKTRVYADQQRSIATCRYWVTCLP